MTRFLLITFLTIHLFQTKTETSRYAARQGQITFFSYTKVENIQATNNTVQSIIDIKTGEIAVSVLMKAFTFKKALMQSHFNESYIESDLYPIATFTGEIKDFDASFEGIQTRQIVGEFTMRNIKKPLTIVAKVSKSGNVYTITGDTSITVADYDINIPPILAPNISENINVSFNLVHNTPYEN